MSDMRSLFPLEFLILLCFTKDNEGNINQNMACIQRDDSSQPKRLRKPGVTILKEILKTIKLDDNLIHENNEILHSFLKSFIEAMKVKDPLFSSVFQKKEFTGSFYSDLRISQPDEFDINIVLKMPFKANDFQVQYNPHVPSYVSYHLKSFQSYETNHGKLLQTFFKDGYLLHENVRRWMQRVVDRALIDYKPPVGITRIIPSASGPARTIQLVKKNSSIIDIDLVPVISCTLDTKQPGSDGRVSANVGPTLEAFLVPKPYFHTSGKQAPINAVEISRLWRAHFPDAEKKIIHDQGCLKPIIKLLKLLRDQEKWKIIASYYLKTVVMWMVLEHSSQKDYWKEDKIEERFIEALQKLQAYVREKKIPYFFSKKHNLISKINDQQAFNISNRLGFIIKDGQDDSKKFWKYFNVDPTF